MVSREDMETALRTKINGLLNNLEKGKQKENELKQEKIASNKQFREEDEIVDQLEEKLKTLEEILLKTETENDGLKAKLFDAEVRFEAENESYIAEEGNVDKLQSDEERKSKELGETVAEHAALHRQANEKSTDILKMSTEGRQEEVLCQQEEERMTCLEMELREVEEKLASAEIRQAKITENSDAMTQRIDEMEEKRATSEGKGDELDIETRRLEKLLEDLTEKLDLLKSEQQLREIQLAERRQMMSNELKIAEEQLKRSTVHQAQSVRKKKIVLV